MTTPAWEEAIWSELDAKTPQEQIVATGDWIVYVTQYLLTKLGDRRRLAVLAALDEEDMDATKLAELIGSRPNTIRRLAEEGRSLQKDEGYVRQVAE